MKAICIASGPSLTLEDIEAARSSGRTVYAINDVYKISPWAEVLYACDGDWWDLHEGVPEFEGVRWTTNDAAAKRWGLHHMAGTSQAIFNTEAPMAYGKNSGFQAINLAYLHGFRDIWLLGYDMGHAPNEPKHFFGEHPPEINRTSQYKDWIDHFNKAAPIMAANGLKITNMTRETALECFERGTL